MSEPASMIDLLSPSTPGAQLGSGVSFVLLFSGAVLLLLGQGSILSGRIAWRFGFDQQRRLPRLGRLMRAAAVLLLLVAGLQWLFSALPAAVTALLSLAIVAVLAVTGTLQDIAGGLYIQLRLRLREGDRLVVGPHEGELRSLHWEHISLRKADGTSVYLPNRLLLRGPIEVYGMRNAVPLRLRIPGADRTAEELARLRDATSVLPYRVPGTPLEVAQSEFGLELQCYVWSEDARRAAEKRLRQLLNGAGARMPSSLS